MLDADQRGPMPPPVAAPSPPMSVPWSARSAWIFTLLALPFAFLVGGATGLIQDPSAHAVVALTLTELGFLIPVVGFLAWQGIGVSWLGFRRFELSSLAIGCGALIVTYGVTIVHNSILLALHWHTQAETFLRFLDTQGSPIGLALGGILVGPLAEEIVFRGFFYQGLLQAYGRTKAILTSSAIFAVIHLDPAAMIPTFLLGCALAFVFDRSRSIWPGVILHLLLNTVGIGALLLAPLLSPGH